MDPQTATLAGLTALGGKELIKFLIKDIYTAAKNAPGELSNIVKTKFRTDRVYTKISQVRRVKTLLHIDKAVDLRKFYHPAQVSCDSKRFPVNFLSDFGTERNIIIRGVAGQGKSILLRSICINELEKGIHLPLFIELRYITEGRTFHDLLVETFDTLGLVYSDSLFSHLANTGRLLLLLDAFDEVHDNELGNVARELEALATKYESLPIIVTSRPNSEICKSSLFDIYQLSNLSGDEYVQVIERLIDDKSISDNLIERVTKHRQGINALITTPLLVTLLVVTYRSFQEIPAQMSDFYDDLFSSCSRGTMG